MSDESVIERTSRCDEYFENLPNFVDDVGDGVGDGVGVGEVPADENVGVPLAFAHQVHKEESFKNFYFQRFCQKTFFGFISFEVSF